MGTPVETREAEVEACCDAIRKFLSRYAAFSDHAALKPAEIAAALLRPPLDDGLEAQTLLRLLTEER